MLAAGTSQATPPSKSMPSVSPLKISETMVMTTRTAEAHRPHHLRPWKSIEVSPWYKRPHTLRRTRSVPAMTPSGWLGVEDVGHDDAPVGAGRLTSIPITLRLAIQLVRANSSTIGRVNV